MNRLTSTLGIITIALASTLPAMAQNGTAAPAAAPAAPRAGAPAAPASTLQQARISPHDAVNARIGSGRGGQLVTIYYGRPYSKNPTTGEIRKVWGTLVPYGKPWRMGSDEATTLITQAPLAFGNVALPAGAYTLQMQPEADGSAKLIISKTIGQWGVPESGAAAGELGRADMKKGDVADRVDQFTMKVENVPGGSGLIRATWENTEYTVPFTLGTAAPATPAATAAPAAR